jgi:hypothetical protein
MMADHHRRGAKRATPLDAILGMQKVPVQVSDLGGPVAGVAARGAPERVNLCGQVRSGRS